MLTSPLPEKWLRWILILACSALFLYQGYLVQKDAVNIPYWDDWAMFAGDDHPASLSWSWLQQQHNEHRIATTRLLVWLQYQLNHWNYPFSLLVNFIIYGVLLVALAWFAHRAKALSLWIILAFIIFLLSPINAFNHSMALQSAFHFYVLFFILSCALLFGDQQKLRHLVLACLAAILCIYSLAGGLVSILFVLFGYSLFKLLRSAKGGRDERRRELLQLAMVVGIVGSAMVLWIVGYTKPPRHPPIVYPHQIRFWLFFVNLVSLGFGYMKVHSSIGLVAFLIVVVPLAGMFRQNRNNHLKLNWAMAIAVLGIFANLASISAGRAGFGVETAKSSRYFEFVMPLVIISAVNWAIFLRDRRRLKIAVVVGLWLFTGVAFTRKWDFSYYQSNEALRRTGAACVRAYYQHLGDGRCPTLYPDSLQPFLEQGRRLNASFYRDLLSDQR
jgi:hypothetical protein